MAGLIELRDFKVCGLMTLLRRALIPLKRLITILADLVAVPIHRRELVLRLSVAGVGSRAKVRLVRRTAKDE
jgi:hypothetical protein